MNEKPEFGNIVEIFIIIIATFFLIYMLSSMPELAEIIEHKSHYTNTGLKYTYK